MRGNLYSVQFDCVLSSIFLLCTLKFLKTLDLGWWLRTMLRLQYSWPHLHKNHSRISFIECGKAQNERNLVLLEQKMSHWPSLLLGSIKHCYNVFNRVNIHCLPVEQFWTKNWRMDPKWTTKKVAALKISNLLFLQLLCEFL